MCALIYHGDSFCSPQRHGGHREGLFKFKRFHHRGTEGTKKGLEKLRELPQRHPGET